MVYHIRDLDIEVDVIYKPKNKRTYLRFKDNKVIITSFKRYNSKEVVKILEQYYIEIKNLMVKLEPKTCITIFNRQYNVVINQSDINHIYIKDNDFIILTNNYEQNSIKKQVDEYMCNILKTYVESRFDDIFSSYSDLLISKPVIKYKNLKSAYGKCYIKRQVIILSTLCVKYDYLYIDYVINHELAHFKYGGHQDDFYNYLESKFKNCKKISRNMKKIKYNDLY